MLAEKKNKFDVFFLSISILKLKKKLLIPTNLKKKKKIL